MKEDFKEVVTSKLRRRGKLGTCHTEGREEDFSKHSEVLPRCQRELVLQLGEQLRWAGEWARELVQSGKNRAPEGLGRAGKNKLRTSDFILSIAGRG